MSSATEFPFELRRLFTPLMAQARTSPETGAEVVEALAAMLALAVANAANGEPAAIDEMCTGLDSYILETATRNAKTIRFVADAARQAKDRE